MIKDLLVDLMVVGTDTLVLSRLEQEAELLVVVLMVVVVVGMVVVVVVLMVVVMARAVAW